MRVQGGVVHAEVGQCLAQVIVGLAAGKYADARVWRVHHDAVQAIEAGVFARHLELAVVDLPFGFEQRWPGLVDADRRCQGFAVECDDGNDRFDAVTPDLRRGAAIRHIGDQLEPDP